MGVLLNPASSCPVAAFLQSSKSSAQHLVTLPNPEFCWKSPQVYYCCPTAGKDVTDFSWAIHTATKSICIQSTNPPVFALRDGVTAANCNSRWKHCLVQPQPYGSRIQPCLFPIPLPAPAKHQLPSSLSAAANAYSPSPDLPSSSATNVQEHFYSDSSLL